MFFFLALLLHIRSNQASLGVTKCGLWICPAISVLTWILLFSFLSEYLARLALERSGSGSGDDEDDDDGEAKGEGSGNDRWYPITEGLKHEEEFVPFEEFKKKESKGVEMKEKFIPFDKDYGVREQSGDGEKGSSADNKDHFVPFDEETNDENSGDVASFARKRL